MDHLNRFEVNGRVGNIRHAEVNGSKVTNFSIVSEYLYKTRDGAVMETTWFNVTAWHNREMNNLENLAKGTPVHVSGRIRSSKYTNSDGVDRHFYEIMATRVDFLNEE